MGGRLFLTGPGMVAAILSSKKDRKFTVIGLTALTGEPVMCVIIIEGSKGNLLLETGIDMDQIEHIDIESYEDAAASTEYNTDFLLNNSGPGKLFPGGPTCHFKGKEIQSMVRFTESGGINSDILTEILGKLDAIGIYKEKREMGMTPFLLVDGHGSRFELPFLDYIHNPEHPWTVAIGVPYGTAKWQVGDSAEQNGQFKTQMTNKKQQLMNKRMETYNQSLGILPTDIMMMINHAWPLSFGNVRTNKKAIEERGWFPFNRNLLLDEEIRQTITIDETSKKESFYFPISDSLMITPSSQINNQL